MAAPRPGQSSSTRDSIADVEELLQVLLAAPSSGEAGAAEAEPWEKEETSTIEKHAEETHWGPAEEQEARRLGAT